MQERLKLARQAAGLTLEQLAERMRMRGQPITRAGLSKYELGKSAPKAGMLLAMAHALDVKPSYFLEEPQAHIQWLGFRKHATLSPSRQAAVKAHATMVTERQVVLQRKVSPGHEAVFIPTRQAKGVNDAEAAAQELRAAWNLGNDPIQSVTQVIEDHGGIVVEWRGDEDFDGLAGWLNGAAPVAVVNMGASRDRCRFNLAHELGHMILPREEQTDDVVERLAHRFAGAFLVPADVARKELGVSRRHLLVRELELLKYKYGMSMQAWVHRAYDLGIISKALYGWWFTEFNRLGWRRHEPYALEGAEQPVRFQQLILHALAENIITEDHAEELCPGSTSPAAPVSPPGRAYGASDLLKLPAEQRERILRAAADDAAEEYGANLELNEFEAVGVADIHDDYPD